VDDYVEVRGQEIPLSDGSGSGEVFAVIVERDDLDTETIIQGFLQKDPSTDPLTILDVVVETDVNTVFENEMDDPIAEGDFFKMIQTGSLIKAKGTNVTVSTASPPVVTLLAEEVEIQTP
jgi:hypothetical protein